MSIEVLEPGELSLSELAAGVEREHAAVVEAGTAIVQHAIAAGDYLIRAREQVEPGNWLAWLEENTALAKVTAGMYMRLARYRDQIQDAPSIIEARRYLTAIEAPREAPGVFQHPEWVKEDARRMRKDGATYPQIAKALGVARSQAYAWCNRERHNQRTREREKQRRALAKEAREREREQAIKQAVRKAGAATAEAYSMAERMQDVLAQAQREQESRDNKRKMSRAGELQRQMRDLIVEVLGVTS